MGSVCVMKPGFWSGFRNQALLSDFHTISAGFNYENRFNIPELGSHTAGMIIPAGRSSLGIIYSHFGFSHFRRETGAVACGLRLSEKLSAGIQADWFFEKGSGEYENIQFITCEAGLLVTPGKNISIGIHIFNPVPNSLRKTFLPSTLRAGAGIRLNETVFAGAELEMSSGENLLLRTGFEYEAARNFILRGGFCTDNSSFSFGLGYDLGSIVLDMSFATHERLGITSSVSMIFELKSKSR